MNRRSMFSLAWTALVAGVTNKVPKEFVVPIPNKGLEETYFWSVNTAGGTVKPRQLGTFRTEDKLIIRPHKITGWEIRRLDG